MLVLTNRLGAVRKQSQQQILDASISAKANLLEQKLQSKLIKLVINDIADDSENKAPMQRRRDEQTHSKLKDFVESSFNSFNENYVACLHEEEESKINELVQTSPSKITGSSVLFRAKFGFRFSKLTDKLLRNMEQNERVRDQLSSILNLVGMNADKLASLTVRLTFQSINLGYLKASDAIPRLLDVVSKTSSPAAKEALKNEFIAESKDTPAWIFLRWISQLIAVINSGESEMIAQKIIQIAKSYP